MLHAAHPICRTRIRVMYACDVPGPERRNVPRREVSQQRGLGFHREILKGNLVGQERGGRGKYNRHGSHGRNRSSERVTTRSSPHHPLSVSPPRGGPTRPPSRPHRPPGARSAAFRSVPTRGAEPPPLPQPAPPPRPAPCGGDRPAPLPPTRSRGTSELREAPAVPGQLDGCGGAEGPLGCYPTCATSSRLREKRRNAAAVTVSSPAPRTAVGAICAERPCGSAPCAATVSAAVPQLCPAPHPAPCSPIPPRDPPLPIPGPGSPRRAVPVGVRGRAGDAGIEVFLGEMGLSAHRAGRTRARNALRWS